MTPAGPATAPWLHSQRLSAIDSAAAGPGLSKMLMGSSVSDDPIWKLYTTPGHFNIIPDKYVPGMFSWIFLASFFEEGLHYFQPTSTCSKGLNGFLQPSIFRPRNVKFRNAPFLAQRHLRWDLAQKFLRVFPCQTSNIPPSPLGHKRQTRQGFKEPKSPATANSKRPKFDMGEWERKAFKSLSFKLRGVPGINGPGGFVRHQTHVSGRKTKSGWYTLEIDTMDTQNRQVMENGMSAKMANSDTPLEI